MVHDVVLPIVQKRKRTTISNNIINHSLSRSWNRSQLFHGFSVPFCPSCGIMYLFLSQSTPATFFLGKCLEKLYTKQCIIFVNQQPLQPWDVCQLTYSVKPKSSPAERFLDIVWFLADWFTIYQITKREPSPSPALLGSYYQITWDIFQTLQSKCRHFFKS